MIFLRIRQIVVVLLLVTLLGKASDVSNKINTTQFEKCSCDMTVNSCDVYCCCDQNCRPDQLEAFTCKDVTIPKETLPSWKCDTIAPSSVPGAHGLFCIMYENTPYLGLFHKNVPLIKDMPSMNYILRKKQHIKLTEKQVFNEPQIKRAIYATGYVYGQEITIIGRNLQTSVLYVPFNLYSTGCDAIHPVQYLKEISSTCLLPVGGYCLSKQLDIHSFVLGDTDQQLLGSFGDEIPLRDINVNYYTPKDPCCYVKTKECLHYGCKDTSLTALSEPPDSPILNRGICHNAALRVDYLFFWFGNRIKTVNMTIVVADVPATPEISITQYFSVKFLHSKNVSDFEDSLNESKKDSFGLTLGYKIESPLFGLFKDAANSNEFDIDATVGNESVIQSDFLIWTNDASGGCRLSSNPLRFGIDVMSGCFYSIDDWTNINCSRIREEIGNMQSDILMAEWINRVPSLSAGNFVQMVHSEDYLNITDENTENDFRMCKGVPHQVHLDIVYTEAFRTLSGPFYHIVAAKRSLMTSDWSPDVHGRSSKHQITSTVQFSYISVDDWLLKQKTKRSHLPVLEPWRKPEVNTWHDFVYPIMLLDLNTSQSLTSTIDATVLVAIFVLSVTFLWSRGRSSAQSSSRRRSL